MFGDSYVRRIVFPIYAQTWRQAPAEIANLYYRVKRIPAALYAFACGGLIGGAPLLMRLLYDPRYASASIFLSLLTISSALRLPNLAAVELMAAMNHMMQTVRLNIARVAWLALTIPIGFAAFGTLGVVIAVGLVEVPAMLFCWILLYRVSVLRMSEELFFIALIVVGAIIGTLISRQVLWLFPYL
jgi:O-antigen/teichoic acid export membrane protein